MWDSTWLHAYGVEGLGGLHSATAIGWWTCTSLRLVKVPTRWMSVSLALPQAKLFFLYCSLKQAAQTYDTRGDEDTQSSPKQFWSCQVFCFLWKRIFPELENRGEMPFWKGFLVPFFVHIFNWVFCKRSHCYSTADQNLKSWYQCFSPSRDLSWY